MQFVQQRNIIETCAHQMRVISDEWEHQHALLVEKMSSSPSSSMEDAVATSDESLGEIKKRRGFGARPLQGESSLYRGWFKVFN